MFTSTRRWAVALGAAAALALAGCSGSGGSSSSSSGSTSGTTTGTTTSGTTTGSGSTSGTTTGSSSGSSGTTGGAAAHFVLLHTNDLHGHLEGHAPELDYSPATLNDDATRGGFARIAAKVASERAAAASAGSQVILADSGDFMMGTAFSSFLGTTQATELYEMTQLQYDAITFGNHEFDFTSAGLAATIQAALTRGAHPPLVASNMNVPASATELTAVMQAYPIPKKLVVTKGGVKIGFVGLLGHDAESVAPLAAPVTFSKEPDGGMQDLASEIQPVVDDLRNNDHADVVIALSHSGTTAQFPDGGATGEDTQLAAATHGIDIIVSGHTHEALQTPVVVNDADSKPVYIVQTGAYGLNLGKMSFTFTPGSGVTVDSYALEPIDDTIAGDTTVQGRIDGYVADIDGLFADAGSPVTYFGPLGHTTYDFDNTPFVETNLGDVVTDAYLGASLQPDGGHADVAVEASGNIRQPLLKGKTGLLAFGDIFNVVPLGIGPDGSPGYPLVEIYLTAADITNGLELSASASDPRFAVFGLYNNDYFLQVSNGLSYTYTPNPLPFQAVTHVELGGNVIYDVSTMPTPDNTSCYRVVCTYYLASLLGLVNQASSGALTVTPKMADCSTAYGSAGHPLSDAIISTPTGAEVKNWQALAGYIAAFPPSGGVPEAPATYSAPLGRITQQ